MLANCDNVTADSLAERYLLERLTAAERDAYERHYFECDRCFGELQCLQTIQAALRLASQEGASAATTRSSQWLRWAGPVVGAAAASLVGVLLVFRPYAPPERGTDSGRPETVATSEDVSKPPMAGSGDSSPAPRASGGAALPAAPRTEPVLHAELLTRLARAEPPRYSPRVLRGTATDEATSAFRLGMKPYAAGDFIAAVPHLRTAARLDPSRPDFVFFLAASELLSGDASAAVGDFERAIDMGETPYREEAHFYLAKALLARGDVARARRELMAVVGLQGELRDDADAILRQLESVDIGR